MKAKIQPKYYPEAKVICAFVELSGYGFNRPEIRTVVCSNAIFLTGQQARLLTARTGDRFYKRLQVRQEYVAIERQLKQKHRLNDNI
jgi:large subunit ribosomal protein L31